MSLFHGHWAPVVTAVLQLLVGVFHQFILHLASEWTEVCGQAVSFGSSQWLQHKGFNQCCLRLLLHRSSMRTQRTLCSSYTSDCSVSTANTHSLDFRIQDPGLKTLTCCPGFPCKHTVIIFSSTNMLRFSLWGFEQGRTQESSGTPGA